MALSRKPTAHCCCSRVMEQTDGRTGRQTDGLPFHRLCSACDACSASNDVTHEHSCTDIKLTLDDACMCVDHLFFSHVA